MKLRLIALLALSTTILTACTTIPRSGPVMSAEIEGASSSVTVDFLPPGPSAGATPEEIIAGFIAAGTAAQDNYQVARSYLSEQIREDWNPNYSVLIQSGEPEISVVSGNTASYAVPIIASVDEWGRYLGATAVTEQALEFRFVRELGEWRLSALPDGIVLSESAFSEAFNSFRLYYFSSGYRELVADVRWFATRGEVSAKIVRALLQAPSFWLDQGSTVSAFPEGTQLALTPIPVVDGVAAVDLTTQVLSADEITRSRMLAQLTASLGQVQGISSAEISVNQNELVIPPSEEQGPSLTTGRDPRLLVVRDRRFGFLQGGQIDVIEPLSGDVASLIPDKVFYSVDYAQAVVTRSDGLWHLVGNEEPRLLDERPDLIRGIIDNCGYIWSSTGAFSENMAQIFSQAGLASDLSLDIGADASLVSFELARDDIRLLLLVQTTSGVRVLLAAVNRDELCRPVSLGEFVELGPLVGRGVDAAWIDDARVAVATQEGPNGVGEVFVFDSSGRSESIGEPLRPQTLVGGVGGISGLRLLAEDGFIYQPRGNGWQATGDRANVLVTQR